MSTYFRILTLVCFVLGSITTTFSMEDHRHIEEAVKIGTLEAIKAAGQGNVEVERELGKIYAQQYDREKRANYSDWRYIEQLPEFSSHPFALHAYYVPKRLEKLREFNNLSTKRRYQLATQAREELEKNQQRKQNEQESKRLLQARKQEHEKLRLENRNCSEVLYEDYVRDCTCCWDKHACKCTPWCLIAGLLCLPTLGFCCTTSLDDCSRGEFCKSCCCCLEDC